MTVVRFLTDGWDFEGALCREIPESWHYFFPEKGKSNDGAVKTAKSICKQCVVKKPCAQYAISNTEITHGIWGGMTFRQIQRIRGAMGLTNAVEYIEEKEDTYSGETIFIEFITERY